MTRIENLLQEFEKYYKNREFITRISNINAYGRYGPRYKTDYKDVHIRSRIK